MPSRVDENGLLRQEGKVLDLRSAADESDNLTAQPSPVPAPALVPKYLRSALWAAGFSFSRGALLCEVPYSPLLPHLFFGEELSMAARRVNGYFLTVKQLVGNPFLSISTSK